MLQLYVHYFLSSFKYKISFSKGVWSYHQYLYCHYFNFFFYPTGIQVTQINIRAGIIFRPRGTMLNIIPIVPVLQNQNIF